MTNKIRTHYDNLQIKENASIEAIKGTYKHLSNKYHPDKNPDNREKSEKIMKMLNQAYKVLSNPELRKEHDDWIKIQRIKQKSKQTQSSKKEPPGNGTKKQSNAPQYRTYSRTKHHQTSSEGAIYCPKCGELIIPTQISRGGDWSWSLLLLIFLWPIWPFYFMFTHGYKYTCPNCSYLIKSDRNRGIIIIVGLISVAVIFLLWNIKTSKSPVLDAQTVKETVDKTNNADTAHSKFNKTKRKAERGNAIEQNNLGVMYEKGQGVQQNYDKALYWYKKSAELGNSLAQNNIGAIYVNGFGVQKNYKKAIYWYEKSAKQGEALGQFNLGGMYEGGYGLQQNHKKAVYWYEKSAKQGEHQAQNNLGAMYQYGKGVSIDISKAIEWLQKAAAQGYVKPQYNLAILYDEQGIYSEAIKWYQKAAEQGHFDAQSRLQILQKPMPTAMVDWMSRNPWFNKDKSKTDFTNNEYDRLILDGWDNNRPKLYIEIDRLINSKFKR